MNKRLLTILISLFLGSYAGTAQVPKKKIMKAIPIAQLQEKGIVPMRPNYKRGYFHTMGYLLFNGDNVFNEVQGDFFNVKYNDYGIESNLNVMPAFFRSYGAHSNSLIVLIAMSSSSVLPLKSAEISVESSKHGAFEPAEIRGDTEINIKQQRILFKKPLKLKRNRDILYLLEDDVITVRINESVYHFLTPELTLD